MRTFGVLSAAVAAACLTSAYAYGQTVEQRPPAEEQFEPYHTHHDTRQGHDHVYPDRGSIVREVPQGAAIVNYAGLSYRFHDGVWYEPRGPAFMVVEPPIGLVVPTLPTFSTVLAHAGDLYLYCNNIYYQPRPDLGGYEVVNDPAENPPKARTASNVGANPAGAVAAPAATVGVAAGAAAATAPNAAASGATLSAANPAAARVAAKAAGPEIESDTPTPATVVPYTVPSAAAVPASSIRVASAKMTPDPAPVAPTTAATSASPAFVGMPAAMPPTASAPAAQVAMSPAAPVAAPPATTPAAAAATPSTAAPVVAAPVAIPTSATAPVTLPASSSPGAPTGPPKGVRAEVSPRNGQSPEQLAKDRYECYQFAVKQSGFDPIHSAGPVPQQQQYEYDRAQSGCFDARGYTVR